VAAALSWQSRDAELEMEVVLMGRREARVFVVGIDHEAALAQFRHGPLVLRADAVALALEGAEPEDRREQPVSERIGRRADADLDPSRSRQLAQCFSMDRMRTGCCPGEARMRDPPAGCTVRGVSSNGVYLELLGAFELSYAGSRIPLSSGAQRLLALLAAHAAGVYRGAAAELLWPDCIPSRASANLKTALCHGRRAGPVTTVECVDQRLRLAPIVEIDLRLVQESAQRM
jgi:hypothetical protein